MLRVLVLLHDANQKGKTSVISELKIVNDGTGDSEYGNYDVELYPDSSPRETCRIERFRRALGAEVLVMEALMELNEQELGRYE